MSSGLRSSTEDEQTDPDDIQPSWEKAEALQLMWLQHIRPWHVDKVDSGSTSCICPANYIWDVWILFNVVADGGRLGTRMTPLHPGFCWSLQVQPLTSIIPERYGSTWLLLPSLGATAVCVQTRVGCVSTKLPPTWHLFHPGPFMLPSISSDRLHFCQAALHSALRTTLAVSFWMQILSGWICTPRCSLT